MAFPLEPRELRLEPLQGKNRVAAAAVVEERESWAARGGGDVVAAAEALGGHRAAVVRRTLCFAHFQPIRRRLNPRVLARRLMHLSMLQV